MGTWGFELYQNDTSLDVKDEFEELYNAGKTAADITDKLINDYKSITGNIDEEPIFWFALADTQWNLVLSCKESARRCNADTQRLRNRSGRIRI